eukprot:scaffold39418_cov50-Phaeocystis_antarctica.AAC.3
MRFSVSSAGSTEPSVPRVARSRCGHLVISPQLLQQRLRQRPQLAAGAAEGHGDAWIERVAQLAEDDALLVTAQLRQRHSRRRGAARAARRAVAGGLTTTDRNKIASARGIARSRTKLQRPAHAYSSSARATRGVRLQLTESCAGRVGRGVPHRLAERRLDLRRRAAHRLAREALGKGVDQGKGAPQGRGVSRHGVAR